MVLFSPAKLENQLASGSLTTWEKAKYLFLASVVAAFSVPVYWVAPVMQPRNYGMVQLLQHLSIIIGMYITYRGIKKCYEINDQKENFIELFVCLRVPWTVLFILVLMPTSLILIITLSLIFTENRDIPYLVIYFSVPLVTYVYYLCLGNSFRRLGCAIDSDGPTTPLDPTRDTLGSAPDPFADE